MLNGLLSRRGTTCSLKSTVMYSWLFCSLVGWDEPRRSQQNIWLDWHQQIRVKWTTKLNLQFTIYWIINNILLNSPNFTVACKCCLLSVDETQGKELAKFCDLWTSSDCTWLCVYKMPLKFSLVNYNISNEKWGKNSQI